MSEYAFDHASTEYRNSIKQKDKESKDCDLYELHINKHKLLPPMKKKSIVLISDKDKYYIDNSYKNSHIYIIIPIHYYPYEEIVAIILYYYKNIQINISLQCFKYSVFPESFSAGFELKYDNYDKKISTMYSFGLYSYQFLTYTYKCDPLGIYYYKCFKLYFKLILFKYYLTKNNFINKKYIFNDYKYYTKTRLFKGAKIYII